MVAKREPKRASSTERGRSRAKREPEPRAADEPSTPPIPTPASSWETVSPSGPEVGTMPEPNPMTPAPPPATGWMKPAEPPPRLRPQPEDLQHSLRAAQTVDGIGWLSHLGWGLAGAGLLLTAYSYWWRNENWPENLDVGGLGGDKLGLGLAVVGFVMGLVFIFAPWHRSTQFDANADSSVWSYKAATSRYYFTASKILSWIGAGLFLLGMLLASVILKAYTPDKTDYEVGGQTASVNAWAGVFGALGVLGAFLWIAFAVRASSHHAALSGYAAAAARATPASVSMRAEMSESGATPAPAGAVGGVKDEDVVALMKKIDGLLASLPDDVVANFSKTPEAETYLKLLERRA